MKMMSWGLLGLLLLASAAHAVKPRQKKLHTLSPEAKAKKICLQKDPYIEGKSLASCIRRTQASFNKK